MAVFSSKIKGFDHAVAFRAGVFPSAAIMLISACPMWLIALHPDYDLIVLYDWTGEKYHSLMHKKNQAKKRDK